MEGAIHSDTPAQSLGKECRVVDLHLFFVSYKGAAEEHAQWRHSEMKGKIDTPSREGPSAPLVIDGGGSAFSAYIAEERNRVSGQELTEAAERARART